MTGEGTGGEGKGEGREGKEKGRKGKGRGLSLSRSKFSGYVAGDVIAHLHRIQVIRLYICCR